MKSFKQYFAEAAMPVETHQEQPAHSHNQIPDRSQFMIVDLIPNPRFNGVNDEPDEIEVGINYEDESTPYTPARVNYDDYDHEEEGGPEYYINQIVNLDTGEDITNEVDPASVEGLIAADIEANSSFEESALLESIKRLSGLK